MITTPEIQKQLQPFLFPIQQREVYIEDYKGSVFQTGDYKAIVRQDDNSLIAIAKKSYKVVPNAEVINQFVENLSGLDAKWYVDSSHSFVENNRMRLMVTFPELTFNDGRSDIALSLYLSNSYDGSESVKLIFAAIRAVCKNGMILGHILKQLKAKHTQGLNLGNLQAQVESTYDQIPAIKNRINQLLETKVTNEFKGIVFDVMGRKIEKFVTDQEASIRPIRHSWDFYNLLTYYVSHEIDQKFRADYQTDISKLFQL